MSDSEKPTLDISEQDLSDFMGVPRFAPQWAWTVIETTVEHASRMTAFDEDTRALMRRAYEVLTRGPGA